MASCSSLLESDVLHSNDVPEIDERWGGAAPNGAFQEGPCEHMVLPEGRAIVKGASAFRMWHTLEIDATVRIEIVRDQAGAGAWPPRRYG